MLNALGDHVISLLQTLNNEIKDTVKLEPSFHGFVLNFLFSKNVFFKVLVRKFMVLLTSLYSRNDCQVGKLYIQWKY